MKSREQKQQWMSDVHALVTGGALLAGVLYAAQALTTPLPVVLARDTVRLEGVVVTPKRTYTETQWALSRPVPGATTAQARSPLQTAQGCAGTAPA